jgi:hypothetical protein
MKKKFEFSLIDKDQSLAFVAYALGGTVSLLITSAKSSFPGARNPLSFFNLDLNLDPIFPNHSIKFHTVSQDQQIRWQPKQQLAPFSPRPTSLS